MRTIERKANRRLEVTTSTPLTAARQKEDLSWMESTVL